jgi:glutamate/tyrosine decarboxylase-like PLP-dependent enzyme
MTEKLFLKLAKEASDYRARLPHMPVGVLATRDELLAMVNANLPDEGEPADVAIQTLIDSTAKGLINSAGPRYFGFVIGGSTPVSVAADWLTSAWDQNAQVYTTSPSAAIIESVVVKWLLDLLDLPWQASVGLVTGAQMANFTALTVARNAVLQQYGWNPEVDGLQAAPHINVICGECCHATIRSAIHLMGLGDKNIRMLRADTEGRMDLEAFKLTLAQCIGPTIICVQAGNVNTGAFDPLADVIELAKTRGAWVHVDGAFGLWANASPRFKYLASGVQGANSWATDAHKWLNVPFDSGIVIIRDPKLHQGFKSGRCAYAGPASQEFRDGSQWVPENSRRARGFVLYAALRHLGKKGVIQIVNNCCDLAQVFARELAQVPGLRILNTVVLNQVLCRIEPEGISDVETFNSSVAARVQAEGVCWLGTTQWHGQTVLRISVTNWSTTLEDVHQSIASLMKSIELELAALSSSGIIIKT